MKDRARELSAKVKETVQQAQKQIQGVEEEVQKFVTKVQDRFVNTPVEGAKKVDDLLRTLAVKDFVEKIRAIEMFKQGQAVKKDLLDRFGLAGAEEVVGMQERIVELEKKLKAQARKKAPVAKAHFTELKKRVEALETPKKAAPKKAAPKKKVAKK